MLTATYHSLLPSGGAPEAPLWLHLLPAGTFSGADGRGPYRLTDVAAVITASMANGKIPVDENHSLEIAAPKGEPSPARGWIVEMQSREDGIWGRVEWTESGTALMADKSYRGISPVFIHNKAGVISTIKSAALTNNPNLTQLATLHSQGTDMDITQLRAALGLPATADEAACLAAVTANAQAVSAHAAQITAIATAAGVTAATPDALVTVLQTERSKLVSIDRVVALQAELDTLRATGRKEAAVAFVDGAIRAGKPINPVRDNYITMHMADPAGTETIINALPGINGGGGTARHAGDPDDNEDEMMSADDKAVCEKMGMEPKAFMKHKKSMAKKGAAA